MKSSPVSLNLFSPGNLPLLESWLLEPFVARWYPEPGENLAWAAEPPEGGDQAVITVSGKDISYLRWQRLSRETLDSVGLHDIPENSVDVDILIGEASFPKEKTKNHSALA